MAKRKKTTAKKKKAKSDIGFLKVLQNRRFLLSLFSLIFLLAIIFGLKFYFLNTEFFAVKEVVINGVIDKEHFHKNIDLGNLYRGRNIFTIDLGQTRKSILKEFPEFREVEVRRSLPGRIDVYASERLPVAVIDYRDGIIVDREGMVLAKGINYSEIPHIKGVSFFFRSPGVGEKVNSRPLDKALAIIFQLKNMVAFNDLKLKFIDVTDNDNIVLGVDNIKVNLGASYFSRNIKRLADIFEDPDLNADQIDYIDLRFENIVIAPK